MLPRDRAQQIIADHAAGKPVRAIARAYGHKPDTVRNYVSGHRTPGKAAARSDDFAPFITYCRQRLAGDPHLRAAALLAEITSLGFPGTQRTFYRALERHEIQPHPCPDCHIARISGYYPLAEARHPQPFPLPVPVSPVNGETLASFLGGLAAANRTSADALLDVLPRWFRVKTRWHDDRWQHDQLTPWADAAAAALAVISGTDIAAIRNALPAFGASSGQAARAVTACRRCTSARRVQQPVPVHLPAHYRICLPHRIWLSGPGTPQFCVSGCPDIIAAEHRARRLLRHYTIEQVIYASIRAAEPAAAAQPSFRPPWKQRMQALTGQRCCRPGDVVRAATWPDTTGPTLLRGTARPGERKQRLQLQSAAGCSRENGMEASEVRRAAEAAGATASALGLQVDDVVLINNSDRIALRLIPCDVLARVAPSAHQADSEFEVEVARRLAEAGGPVAELEPRVECRVFLREGFAISLWTYYEPAGSEIAPAEYANALMRLHAALRQTDLEAPRLSDRVAGAQREVDDRERTPALPGPDRELLSTTLSRLSSSISRWGAGEQLLHGEPHPGNLLSTRKGPLFVDLETCCRGPIELDVAHAPEEVAAHYPGADHDLIRQCRVLMWALFSTWRWRRDDQLPDGHYWRMEGLNQVRAALDRCDLDWA